jgi:N-acetylneuraminate synthase/N,N'-diacetyllegionaminate synthase
MDRQHRRIEIGSRPVGQGEPIFICVETGVTHGGSLDAAKRLVDAAQAAGADAIKFQVIGAEAIMSDRTVEYTYATTRGTRTENMFQMFKGLEFTREQWRELRDHAFKRDIILFATTDYEAGVDLLEELDVPAYKVSSWDMTDFPLLRRMARTGRPLILDTGPTTMDDLCKVVRVVCDEERNPRVAFLHATHSSEPSDINMRSIPYMRQLFGTPVGFSSPGRDNTLDFLAIGLGVDILEKRLTLSRQSEGHHHILSLEPDEFGAWVDTVRRLEAGLGRFEVRPAAEDLRLRKLYWRSVVAARDLPAGTVLTEALLRCKRPGTGIAPEFLPLLVGRTTRRPLRADEILKWDDV